MEHFILFATALAVLAFVSIIMSRPAPVAVNTTDRASSKISNSKATTRNYELLRLLRSEEKRLPSYYPFSKYGGPDQLLYSNTGGALKKETRIHIFPDQLSTINKYIGAKNAV